MSCVDLWAWYGAQRLGEVSVFKGPMTCLPS